MKICDFVKRVKTILSGFPASGFMFFAVLSLLFFISSKDVYSQDTNRYYWLEAETAESITSPMQVSNDGTASGGQYIWVPNGQGNNWDGTGGYAEYTVNITVEGEYILWGRVIATSGSDDSFFAKVGSSTNKAWSVAKVSSWQWDKVNIKSGVDPVTYYLTTGNQTIRIGQREDGTKLDKLLLTDDLNYVPTGTGGGFTDADGDGYVAEVDDCDDTDPAINPGATELCDGVDNNCDGQVDEGLLTTYFQDLDSDTYGSLSVTQDACSQPAGFVTNNTDCDDTDAAINPGVTEVCDGIDNDCDGLVDEGFDIDGDGFTTCNGDCDDTNAAINPGATEVSDGIDNNCNGQVDEATTTYYWLEAETAESITSPMQISNDGAASGGQYIWVPNGQGNNWDGTGGYAEYTVNIAVEGEYVLWGRVIAPTSSDDSLFAKVGSSANKAWAVSRVSSWQWDKVNIKSGVDPVTYYLTTGNQTIRIGQREDGTKLDKLLLTHDLNYVPTGTGGNSPPTANDGDGDGDGFTVNQGDCNDADADEHPGQTWYKDADNDGYSDGSTDTTSCTRPAGYKVAAELTATSGDCDDNDSSAKPDTITDNLNNGLIAFYPFNGNANDESGNSNNGTVNGATLTVDRFGNANSAYNFDGVNNFISVDHYDSLEPSYGLTLSAWIRNTHPLGKWGDNNVISKDAKIGNTANGYLLRTGSPEDELIVYAGGKKPDHHDNVLGHDTKEWLHFVGTYTSGSQIALYVDGELMTADTGGVPSYIPYTHSNLVIGGPFNGGANYFSGMIDDVRIYNRALSDSEVQDLYNYTGTTEVCDGVDNNCNGQIDEGITTTYYEDADLDGYGNPFVSAGCPQPVGYVTDNTDCDDSDPDVNPGAVEISDGVDNNCDGQVDGAFGYYWIEAETVDSITSPMQISNDGDASGGQYISVPNGQGDNWNGSGAEVVYPLDITVEGEYVLWGRVIAPTSSDDSFFVKVGSSAHSIWDVVNVSSWQWDKVNIRGGADPAKYYLTAGEQTITIGQRMDGTRLDKLLLTSDMDFIPVDFGGN